MIWTIEPVRTATLRSPGPEVFFQRDFERQVDLAIYSFVVRSDTHAVLIDTGLGEHEALNADIRARKGEWSGFHVDPTAQRQLAKREFDRIVVTTFGPYAVGNLDLWPSTPVVHSRRGWEDLQRPEVALFSRRLSDGVRERLKAGVRVAGSTSLFPGLSVIELGAHSPSAMGVVIETRKGRIAIADPVFVAENLTRGIPLGWCESLPDWFAMFDRLGDIDGIIPIHDPKPEAVPRDKWHPLLRARGRSERQ